MPNRDGEHPAPVDVADHQHRQREAPGQAHVHVVAGPQVDLGRRPGALADDHVVAVGQLLVRGERGLAPDAVRPVANSPASSVPAGCPRTTTNDRRSEPGLEQHRVHRRFRHRARRPAPAGTGPGRSRSRRAQTIELLDMFCALNGATRSPCRARNRHSPAVTRDFPASDEVPATSSPRAGGRSGMVGTQPRYGHPFDFRCAPPHPTDGAVPSRLPLAPIP